MALEELTKEELVRELEAARARIAKLEKEVSEREKRFQVFMDSSPAIAWAKDEEGRYIYLNRALENRFGIRLADWHGKTDPDLWPAEIAEKFRRNDAAVLESGQLLEVTEEAINPDGSISYWWDFKFPFQDASGRRYVGGIGVEVTERKKAEEAFRATEKQLREQAARLQATLDAAPVVILSAQDSECREIYGNRFARELAGVPEGANMSRTGPTREMIGHFRIFKGGVEMKTEDLPLQRVASSGVALRNFSYEWVFDNGETRTIFGDIVPVLGSDGKPSGAVAALMDITEQKRAEEALRESREDLNWAQAVAHTGNWRLNIQRNELRWSEESHRIFGVPPDTPLTYQTFLSIVHPDDREYVDTKWKAGLRGEPYDIEHRIVVGESVKWVRERAELEFGKDGALLGGFGTTQDITERKEAEQALRQSAQRLKYHFENSPIALLEWDADFVVTRWSVAAEQMFGWKAEETIGKRIDALDMIYEEDIPIVDGLMKKLVSGEERALISPNRNLTKSGKVIDCIWHNSVLFDDQGEMVSVMSLAQDVTERKRAEDALKKAVNEAENEKRRLEAVMEALPIGVAIVDELGGNVRSNSEYERIWGGRRVKARPPVSTVKDYAAYQAWWADTGKLVSPEEWGSARAVEKGETVVGQVLEISRFDGSHGFVLNSAAPIRDVLGKIAGAAVVIQDITELRHAQDALRESEAKYRQLAKSLKRTVKEQVERVHEVEHLASMGRMVAIVAHEIRNPLLNIQLGMDTFRATLSGDTQNLEILSEVEYGLHQLNDTVGELLEYARAIRLEPVAQPIGPLVRNTLKALLYKMHDVAVRVGLEEQGRKIIVDSPKMTRALMNIISNAVEAMPEGGTLSIESKLSSRRRLTLSVSDTGHGMDAETLSMLFQPFHTTKVTGTGLGLGITKKIIEAHGGRISIKSKPNKGTTVKIVLPIAP